MVFIVLLESGLLHGHPRRIAGEVSRRVQQVSPVMLDTLISQVGIEVGGAININQRNLFRLRTGHTYGGKSVNTPKTQMTVISLPRSLVVEPFLIQKGSAEGLESQTTRDPRLQRKTIKYCKQQVFLPRASKKKHNPLA